MNRYTSRRARSGFTLIEMLVVLSIIFLLAALILPAVQQARELGRRSQCTHNMASLATALSAYESAHSRLPSGVLDEQSPIVNLATGRHQGWIVELLPYLDQQNAYDQVDQEASVYAAVNAPVRDLQLRRLICPSGRFVAGIPGPGMTNYAGCHHDVEAPIDGDNSGVLYRNSQTRLEDITDGATYTIFFGEKRIGDGDLGWMSGTRASLRNTGTRINGTLYGQPWKTTALRDAPRQQIVPDPDDSVDRATDPTEESADQSTSRPATWVGGFGSWHAGGAQFSFGNGSVQFLSGEIDPLVYQRLGSRADGNLTGDFEY